MENPPDKPSSTVDHVPAEGPGARIGPYKLLQQIGEGGMGVVYMAEQEQPVRRRVALKIIKPGMDSAHVIARFKAEQQALALMDHQNIAKVFDAGMTANGRPFFVMELVHGVPITKYCDDNKLTPRERLELFVPVCRAVQHAHQKGIIHRDLKPSNVLVCLYDGKPVAKVIDFGVAKAMEQPLTDATMFTQFGQVIGTLEYMSPEQAEMSQLGIDTRSDIYSLGVMMYELLTGTTPLQKQRIKTSALDEVLRLIREEEPPAPSSRLSSSTDTLPKVSQQRRTEPAQLTKLVRGELDWIVMRALEKDRTRRYDTASAFAQDIEHYLADEPVQACPPSRTYLLRKYAHKHRALLTTAAAFTLILVIGAGVSVWQAIRATNAEGIATKALDDAKKAQKKAEDEYEKQLTANANTVRAQMALQTAGEKLRSALYMSDMNLVRVAWEARQPQRALDLLERHRPKDDETDLRGFEWFYWKRRMHSETRRTVLEGVTYPDNPFGGEFGYPPVFSHDGRRFALLYKEGDGRYRLKVWDTETEKLLLTMPYDYSRPKAKDAHGSFTYKVAFFPDDTRLLISFNNFHYAVVRVDGAKVLSTFNDLSMSMDKVGNRLIHEESAMPGKPWAITWYDADTGAKEKTLSFAAPDKTAAFFSHDEDFERFAYVVPSAKQPKDDKQVRYEEIHICSAAGKLLQKILLPEAITPWPPQLVYSKDRKRLIVGPVIKLEQGFGRGDDFVECTPISCWNLDTGKMLWKRASPKSRAALIDITPNGRRLLIRPIPHGSKEDRTPYWLDVATGDVQTPLEFEGQDFTGPGSFVGDGRIKAAPFSPDGELLVLMSSTGWLNVCSTQTGRSVFETHLPTGYIGHFTRDGSKLMTIDKANVVRSWDTAPWTRRARIDRKQAAAKEPFHGVNFEQEGKLIVSDFPLERDNPLGDHMVRIYSVADGKLIRSLGPVPNQTAVEIGARSEILMCVPTKEGAEMRLLEPGADKGRVLWTFTEGGRLEENGNPTTMWGAFLLPGRRAVALRAPFVGFGRPGTRSELVLVDIDTAKRLPAWWDDLVDTRFLMLSSDRRTSTLIARRKADAVGVRRLFVAETNSGRILSETSDLGFDAAVRAVSPDGRHVLLCNETSAGAVIQLRDVVSGAVRFHVKNPGFNPFETHAIFSPDGQRLCFHGELFAEKRNWRIWDLDGNELCQILVHGQMSSFAEFSRDGHRIMAVRTGYEHLPPEEMLEVIDATPLPGDESRNQKR